MLLKLEQALKLLSPRWLKDRTYCWDSDGCAEFIGWSIMDDTP